MKKFYFIFLLLVILFTITINPVLAEERIGVVTNFFPEIKPFLNMIEPEKLDVKVINGVEFFQVVAHGKKLVIFMGGADQAAASASLQKAIDEFKLTKIIVCGVGGGISKGARIGDVIIPGQWANHTYGYLSPKNKNFAPFFKPEKKFPEPYGFMYHDKKELNLQSKKGDIVKEIMWFPIDRKLLKEAGKIKMESISGLKKLEGNTPRLIVGGNGVSGSWFVDNYEYRLHLDKYFKADIVDIESQALCQVAMMNRIPILVVRSVSDYAGNEKDEQNKVWDNLTGAAHNSSEVVWQIIKNLGD